MMFQRKPLTIAILAASLGLAACNSNDHDNVSSSASTTTITVTPSLGKILSGRVVLRDAKTGQDLAPAKTLTPADNGTATFTVPIAKLAEPVVAAVLPNLLGKVDYADEAIPNQVTTITVANADINKPIIRAAASLTPNSNLGVTALTEAAVQQAEKASGGLIAQNINQANAAVKNQLKLNFDITQAPIVVGLGEFDKLINQALDQQRRTYAAYLATLAKESKRLNPANTQPAFDMAKAFAADFSDGTFDGKEGLAALTIYNSQFITAWSNWVQTFYSQFIQFNTLAALNTWVGNFNAEQPTTNNTNTCASKNLPTAQLSSIADFVGSYLVDNNGVKSTLTLGANGDVSLNNQSSSFKEVCGPNVQNNGTNFVLITQQGNVTLFKDNSNVITAEGEDFTTTVNDVFYGPKQTQTNNTQILHPAMVRTYFGQVWQTTGTGIPARTPCTISLNQAGELSVSVASVRYAVTIPNQILDFDTDLTQDGNRIKAAGSYSATWAGRAHTTNYGIGWAHYTSSNVADGPVSTSVLPYANGSYASTPQIVCDTYSTTGGPTPLGDGAAGAIEIGTDGSFKAATVTAKAISNARVQTWTDPAYGEISVTYGSANKVIASISIKRTVGGTKSFDCSGTACAGARFDAINKVPSLVLNNVSVTGSSTQKLNGVLLESLDANNPPVDNTNTCTSQGSDDTLGFASAPNDFCSFHKLSSTAITAPDIYTFVNGSANVKVTVESGVVSKVMAENNTYAFSCGLGGTNPACSGITFNNGANTKEFIFNNTILAPLSGQGQALTVKNGSLIHQVVTSTGGTTLGGGPATFPQAAYTQGTSFGGSSVAPTTGTNDFKLVILTDGVPPYGHASKIAFSGNHSSSTKTTTVVGFATKADQVALSATQYMINGYSVDVVGQELQVNVGGYRCSFDANKPFSVFGNSTNGVAVSYQTPLGLDVNCNVQITFGLNNIIQAITMTQLNQTPNAMTPYYIVAGFNGL